MGNFKFSFIKFTISALYLLTACKIEIIISHKPHKIESYLEFKPT